MAIIIKGKRKGKYVKLEQWCNDWFTVAVDDETIVVSPSMLQLTLEEATTIVNHKNNGILFNLFTLTDNLRFERKKKYAEKEK